MQIWQANYTKFAPMLRHSVIQGKTWLVQPQCYNWLMKRLVSEVAVVALAMVCTQPFS